MNCEIITIGDELLIGQVVDTNSAWMATRLNDHGFRLRQITTVGDEITHILDAVRVAFERADILLLTGGLGPTNDDLTKEALTRYFDSSLVPDQRVVEDLTRFFAQRGKELTETNRKQADLPQACEPLYNSQGTAPGMWFDHNDKILVSMPGVPHEMKSMMNDQVLPRLTSRYRLPPVFHQTIITTGVGESFLADLIREWEESLPKYIKLAYLPSVGTVKLRLSCYGATPELQSEVLNEVEKVKKLIPNYIFTLEDTSLQQAIGHLLQEHGQTLAIAESCTGGYLSHLITSVPGSSAYYVGSTISYANEVKSRFLGVEASIINKEGAVSEEVARAMASGVRDILGTSWALSTTGVAGPGGGTPEKPVGTVWIGLAGPGRLFARKFQFGQNRMRNVQATAVAAFSMLREAIVHPDS